MPLEWKASSSCSPTRRPDSRARATIASAWRSCSRISMGRRSPSSSESRRGAGGLEVGVVLPAEIGHERPASDLGVGDHPELLVVAEIFFVQVHLQSIEVGQELQDATGCRLLLGLNVFNDLPELVEVLVKVVPGLLGL